MEEATNMEGNAGSTPAKPPRFSKKMIITISACLLLLVIGGGIAAWMFMGKSDAAKANDADKGATEAANGVDVTTETYIEVPDLIVNLRSADGAPRLIKLRLMLVPAKPTDGPAITARLPLIIDSFQPFLRELRPEDLAGSAAIFRIKEELLIRANGAAGQGTVKSILIQDLIQQ